MSRMILLVSLYTSLNLLGCATNPCGPCGNGGACGGSSCGLFSCCGLSCLCGRGCSDCVPMWTPYFGHYKWRCDDCVTRMTALRCAWHDLDELEYQSPGALSGHFSAGFEQAYVDLAENRAPKPPSYPPSKYWTAYYRSCAGRPCVEEWYAGYQTGLEHGLQRGVSQFNRIDVWTCGNPAPSP